jgi:hypothetical protein
MKIQRVLSALVVVLLGALFIVSTGSTVLAQSVPQQTDVKEDETNLDTQLYLIVATNQSVNDEKLPTALDGVVKQLRSTLPFRNYRLAATLINRVKNEGRLDLSWIGGPLAAAAGSSSPVTPSFSQFKVRTVKLTKNSAGDPVVQMLGFQFGARIPIQVGAVAVNGGVPATNYEPTGLATDISIREGEPVIVGTLNVGPSGDAIILVVSAKRTSR